MQLLTEGRILTNISTNINYINPNNSNSFFNNVVNNRIISTKKRRKELCVVQKRVLLCLINMFMKERSEKNYIAPFFKNVKAT